MRDTIACRDSSHAGTSRLDHPGCFHHLKDGVPGLRAGLTVQFEVHVDDVEGVQPLAFG